LAFHSYLKVKKKQRPYLDKVDFEVEKKR